MCCFHTATALNKSAFYRCSPAGQPLHNSLGHASRATRVVGCLGVASFTLRISETMSDFEQLSVHKSADSLSVHKARLARPRLGLPEPEDEDEQDYEDDVPDSPGCDTEVQARVDSIALAQKRLSAEKASKYDSPKPSKSRFGRVKMAEDSPESEEKKIGVATGIFLHKTSASLLDCKHTKPPVRSVICSAKTGVCGFCCVLLVLECDQGAGMCLTTACIIGRQG